MRSLRTLDVVEAYFDAELTPHFVARLHDIPLSHFEALEALLASERQAWREETAAQLQQDTHAATATAGSLLLLDSGATHVKPLLLYAESLALLDPVDTSGIAPVEGPYGPISWREEDEETQQFIWISMLRELASLRPLLVDVDGIILVSPGFKGKRLPYSAEDFIEQWCGPDRHRSLKDKMMYLEERAVVERQGELLSLAGNIGHLPCTGRESMLDLLGSLNLPETARSAIPGSIARTLSTIAEYRVPELANYDLKTLIDLRRNNDAFAQFRGTLRQALATTHQQMRNLPDGIQANRHDARRGAVVAEFRAQLDDHLRPELQRLESALKSSTFSQLFLPTALPLTFGMVGTSFYGESLASALLGAGAAASGYALAELARRPSKEFRRDKVLQTAYLGLGKGQARL